MMADARVLCMRRMYFLLETNVRSPGPASSIPATRRISTSPSDFSSQPSFRAISDNFIRCARLVWPSRGVKEKEKEELNVDNPGKADELWEAKLKKGSSTLFTTEFP